MELLSYLVDFVLHIDDHLFELVANYGLWIYAILFVIVFCETGLVVTPFLPGDSLLFASGVVARHRGTWAIWKCWGVLLAAGITGDAVNYSIGRHVGPAIFSRDSRLIKKEHLLKAHAFYERHGGKGHRACALRAHRAHVRALCGRRCPHVSAPVLFLQCAGLLPLGGQSRLGGLLSGQSALGAGRTSASSSTPSSSFPCCR